jgi:ATP/maltotriose-dependent transcriptional regulator MalT
MLNRARTASQALVKHDPENSLWLTYLAVVEIDLARIALATGKMSRARTMGEQALLRLQPLHTTDVTDVLLTRWLARAYQVNSQIQLADGNTREARSLIDSAAAATEEIGDRDLVNTSILASVAQVLVTRGRILTADGDPATARADWQAVIRMLASKVPDSSDYELLDPWIRAHLLSGSGAAARDALDRLQAAGYQPLEPWPAP